MKDRIPTKPGRVKVTREDGTAEYVTLERADEPTEEGTPLSKATLLKDETAALYGLGEDATPDQVLAVSATELKIVHAPGAITLVAAPLTDLPESVLPCTGGYYEKDAFPKLFDAIGFRCGAKVGPVTETTTNPDLVNCSVSGHPYEQQFDPVRHEFYCCTYKSYTARVYDKNLTLVRTLTFSTPISRLTVYDGILAAYSYDSSVSTATTYYISMDGGETMKTFTVDDINPQLGMTKTKIYLGHAASPKTLIVYDKLTDSVQLTNMVNPPTQFFSFTNEDYMTIAYSVNKTFMLYAVTDAVLAEDMRLINYRSIANTTVENECIYKNLFIGIAQKYDPTKVQLIIYDLNTGTITEYEYPFNNSNYRGWSITTAGVAMLPSTFSHYYSGLLINVTSGRAFPSPIEPITQDSVSGSYGVLTDAGYCFVTSKGTVNTGPFPTLFRVPEAVDEIRQWIGYIHTGED